MTVDTAPPFEQELATLKAKLQGKHYSKAIQELLPEMTLWQIRRVMNGRVENQLVLRALRVLVYQQEARLQAAEKQAGISHLPSSCPYCKQPVSLWDTEDGWPRCPHCGGN